MPALFFLVAWTPVAALGCRNRGLLALLIAVTSGLWALAAAIAGARGRLRGDPDASRWAISALVLAVPVVAMLVLA